MSTMVDQEDHSTLSMNQLLLEALDHRWKNYDAELRRCRSDISAGLSNWESTDASTFDPEPVHRYSNNATPQRSRPV